MVFLTSVQCQGYEDQLIHCRHDFGENICTSNSDVLLNCGKCSSPYFYSCFISYVVIKL